MQSALRKIGNSTGIVLPRSILNEIGVTTGALLDLTVDGGRLIATPVAKTCRAGWDVAAAQVAASLEPELAEWRGFGNAADHSLEW